MTCVFCKHGQTSPDHATFSLGRGPTTVVFRDVPAEICDNCGEPYLSSEITRELLERVDIAAREGVEVAVVRHAA